MATKKCFSCRQGEIDREADYYVTGYHNGRPIRGCLCSDHLEMMEEDGMVVRSREILNRLNL